MYLSKILKASFSFSVCLPTLYISWDVSGKGLLFQTHTITCCTCFSALAWGTETTSCFYLYQLHTQDLNSPLSLYSLVFFFIFVRLHFKTFCQLTVVHYICFSKENLIEINTTKEVCFQSSGSSICSLFASDVMLLRENHASVFQSVPKEHQQQFSAQIYCCP